MNATCVCCCAQYIAQTYAHITCEDSPKGLVDPGGGDLLNLAHEIMLSAKVQHLLELGRAASIGTGDQLARAHEAVRVEREALWRDANHAYVPAVVVHEGE